MPRPAARNAQLAAAGLFAALAALVIGCRGPTPSSTATPAATSADAATATADAATSTATAQVTASGSASATPADVASPTAPVPGATDAPAVLDQQLDRIERAVEDVRGLRPEGETKRRFVDSETLAAVIGRELDEKEDQIGREQKLYTLLGLIEPGADLDHLYRGLLGSQVLGLYDPETEEFLVLHTGGELGALAESTYAHEYVHRLQDVRFDLDALSEAAEGNDDREIALAALIEGDATVTQVGYALKFMSRVRLNELARAPEQFKPPPQETPFILLQGLEFPYTAGPSFVAALRGSSAGFEAVDRAYADPPTTSEQILHPEKYRQRESAAEATIPDATAVLGAGWTAGDLDVLGEFFLKTWLTFLARPNAAAAAAGWGGDSYRLFTGPGDSSALLASIVWDRPEEDAQEFFDALVGGLDGSARLRRVTGDGPTQAIWQGDDRAIGVRLGGGGAGVILAAAPQASQVEALLVSVATVR